MAGFGVAFVIPMLLLLPHGAVGASLSASGTVIRREAKPTRLMDSMSMTPSGELVQSKPETEVERAADYCDVDFVLGIAASNDCAITSGLNGVNHHLITTESMCKQAANEAGGLTQLDMSIGSGYQNLRPKGCFQQPCSEVEPAGDTMAGDTHVCYFFNGNKETPGNGGATIIGTPVCHRMRYLNYIAPDTDTRDAGCPVGYRVILEDLPCRQVQNCLGDAPGDQFRVGLSNASQHLDYPLGCFIDKVDHKIYINEASQMGRGTSITGTLLCKVKVSSRDATNYTHPDDSAPTAAPE